MSLLPQSKKSTEEIAKLRESLGIVGPPPTQDALPVASQESTKTREPAMAPLPIEEISEPKTVRSLKRSEWLPQLPGPPAARTVSTPLPVSHPPKMVRSLRKSEQGPIAPVPPPSSDSKLPVHRHSEKEIHEIRRQEMLAAQSGAGHLKSLTAHPVLIVPGYLFAIAAAVGIHFYDVQREIAAGCVVAALIVAVTIFFKKPLSVHHAAFITVASLLVIVFGALHYFPQLRHGT